MNMIDSRRAVRPQLIGVGCVCWFASAAVGAQWVVDAGGQGTHTNIQSAINDAADGDDVLVMPGVYGEHIDFNGKAVRVRGSAPGDADTVLATVIDGGDTGTVVTFQSGEGAGSVIEGITIRDGESELHGGGVMCVNGSSPKIVGNRIVSNGAWANGGGVYVAAGSSPLIKGNVIFGNRCEGRGAGVYAESGSPRIERNQIDGNVAGCSGGGGVYLTAGTDGTLVFGNDITRNYSRLGGGIAVAGAGPRIERNRIISNVAFPRGGGVALSNTDVTMVSNVIAGNKAAVAAAIDVAQGSVVIRSNSIVGNWATDAGIVVLISNAEGHVSGNVLAYNRAGIAIHTGGGGAATADYNCLFGNPSGNFAGSVDQGSHNVFTDPGLAAVGAWVFSGLGQDNEDAPCEVGGQLEYVLHFSGPGPLGGYVQYRIRPDRERFDILLTGFPSGQHSVFINDVVVGQIFVDGGGVGELEFDTNDGNFPPTFPDVSMGDIARIGVVASGPLGPGWTNTGDMWLAGDEHLQNGSVCRDAGPPILPPEEDADIDGQPRVSGSATDIGADEVVPAGNGDADVDGDVDFGDVGRFQLCFGGQGVALPAPECAALDFDGDLDVDLGDWQALTGAMTGPG